MSAKGNYSSLKLELATRPPKEQIPKEKRVLILICAYNEAKSLPALLQSLPGRDVLIVDDGSSDSTSHVAAEFGVNVLSHPERLGKAISLSDGISYALQNSYDMILEIDADAIPGPGSIEVLVNSLSDSTVGGASCKQIPVGRKNISYFVDDLIWALLLEGKRQQMRLQGTSHLGAVMYGFKPELVDSVEGSINDDEEVGLSVKMKGYRTIFVEKALVYFDASSCIGHILQRRERMYYGHMKYDRSTAPSMQIRTSLLALACAIREKPSRAIWTIPALLLDTYARLKAWRDVRKNDVSKKYSRWVTTYAKDNTLVIRSSNRR